MARDVSESDFLEKELPLLKPMAAELRNDPLLDRVPEVDGYKALGPCLLYEKVGAGGMGAVYRAYHRNLNIPVCVKCLCPKFDADEAELVKRFKREARLLATLNHENLVRVYDVNKEHGIYFIIMELVEGESANKLLPRAGDNVVPLTPNQAVALVLKATRGLVAMHEAGIVHRDIKPHNILIRSHDGVVKLADLGLAANKNHKGGLAPGEDGALTQADVVFGSGPYMPPEQWDGLDQVCTPGDVWAMGATLYYLLVGHNAYRDREFPTLMKKICSSDPFPDIREIKPDVPSVVVAILDKCTRKNPSERYQDARELCKQLERCAQELPTALELENGDTQTRTRTQFVTRVEPLATSQVPTWIRLAGGLLVIVMLAVGAWYLYSNPNPGSSTATQQPVELEGFKWLGKSATGHHEYLHEQTNIRMVFIPAAQFQMGEDAAAANEKPSHTVNLDAFLIAKYEVTQKEWATAMGKTLPPATEENLPMVSLTWQQCHEFCLEKGLSLPTEAQWEYACRGEGAESFLAESVVDSLAWHKLNSDDAVQPVGRKKANEFGLHDMLGNVSEWCADRYDPQFYRTAAASQRNPECKVGEEAVLRGGSFRSSPENLRATFRSGQDPMQWLRDQGFRPAFSWHSIAAGRARDSVSK